MSDLTREKAAERFAQMCRERGIPLTIQRRAVLEALLDSGDHPTADDVYQRARDRAPGIAQTTVYRVLELLEQTGLAARINHTGNVSRYDASTASHDHLRCIACQRIVDVSGPPASVPPLLGPQLQGFDVRGHTVVYEGVCPDCRAKAGAAPAEEG